jgi:hypothetical protein
MDMSGLKKVVVTGLTMIAFSLIAVGQSGSLGGPTLGFVQDDQGTMLWPILGVLGASLMGPRLELSAGIIGATISPKHDYAIAIRTEDAQVVIVDLNIEAPRIAPVADALANASMFGISPTGSAAALYSDESKRLQIFRGLPLTPSVAFEFDASILAGDVHGIAVTDDAQLALISVGSGESSGLWAANAWGSWRLTEGRSLMIFLAFRHDVVIAEDAVQRVSLLQSIDQSPSGFPLWVFSGEPRAFSGVAATTNGGTVFVTRRGSGDVTVLDLETQSLAVRSCACEPTGLFPLKGAPAFRLNGLTGGPMTVLDVSSPDAQMVVIPPHPNLAAILSGR